MRAQIRWIRGVAGGLVVALFASSAHTQVPITDNRYAIEVSQGVLTAPVRVLGLGGAYAGSPEWTEGGYANAAAPALRSKYSLNWVDFDLSPNLSFPGIYSNSDFSNRGDPRAGRALRSPSVLLSLGMTLQLGSLGISLINDLQTFELRSQDPTLPTLRANLSRVTFLLSHGFWQNQLLIGAGIRNVDFDLRQGGFDDHQKLFSMTGLAPQVGFLIKPNETRWRLGATFRAAVVGKPEEAEAKIDATGRHNVGGYFTPDEIALPWELEVGVAYQWGARPLNSVWFNPHDQIRPLRDWIRSRRTHRAFERKEQLARAPSAARQELERRLEQEEESIRAIEEAQIDAQEGRLHALRKARADAWPREKLLLLASVLVTGPSSHAVGLISFVNQQYERYGNRTTASLRLGLEAEPLPHWIRARVGGYLEPSRWEGLGRTRPHFTCGLDAKLFSFDAWGLLSPSFWRISAGLDVASLYFNWGLSFGVWH